MVQSNYYGTGSVSTTASVYQGLVFGTGTNPTEAYSFTMGGTPSTGSRYYQFDNPVKATAFKSNGNCASSASPAVCSAYAAGWVAMPTNATASTLVINTSAVTATSQIQLTTTSDTTVGTALGVTCNTSLATLTGGVTATARTAGTSFTIQNNVAVSTNPLCVAYFVIN